MGSAEGRQAVLILGGGPAGLVTALRVVKRGGSAVVVECGRYDGIRIGEHLPPERVAVAHNAAQTGRDRGHPGFCKPILDNRDQFAVVERTSVGVAEVSGKLVGPERVRRPQGLLEPIVRLGLLCAERRQSISRSRRVELRRAQQSIEHPVRMRFFLEKSWTRGSTRSCSFAVVNDST